MSATRWCVHHASRTTGNGRHEVYPVSPKETWGGSDIFAYVLTETRELLTHAEIMALPSILAPRPRVIRVAVRRTFAQIDRLSRRWGSR